MPIRVPAILYREIEQVREVAKERGIDLLDPKAIAELAKELNLGTLHLHIVGNPRRYLTCIKEGMEQADVA